MSDIEFYEFRRGVASWLYTSRRKPLVYQGRTFEPATIKRSGISQSQELQRNTLDLTVPLNLPVLSQFQPVAAIAKITLLVRVLPSGETTARGIWGGSVSNIEDNNHRAIIHCLPASAGLAATGLAGCWQKTCRHDLYGPGCGASRADVRVDGTLTAVTTTTVEAAAFAGKPDGWFDGGFITWSTPDGLIELRYVISHVGAVLTLLTPANVAVGTVVATYPGCNRTTDDCDTKHHNIPRFGGQPYIPPKVPFNNNPGF